MYTQNICIIFFKLKLNQFINKFKVKILLSLKHKQSELNLIETVLCTKFDKQFHLSFFFLVRLKQLCVFFLLVS